MLDLAESESHGPVRVDDIAERLEVPRNYLSKILHALARGGVLTSTRGPGGGFELARPASEIKLSAVVSQFDDLPPGGECLLGRESCRDDDPCAAHAHWKEVSVKVREFFNETTIADLSRDRSLAGSVDTG